METKKAKVNTMMTDNGVQGFLLCVFGVPLWLLYILCVMTIIKEVLERWWMK